MITKLKAFPIKLHLGTLALGFRWVAVRIASKINTALLAAIACGTLATFTVLNATIKPQFDAIERSGAMTNHKRVTDALESLTEKLQTATQDYAFWDESYAFLQGDKTDEYVSSNLTPELKAVESLGINALVFQKTDGEVLWGVAYDLETKDALAGIVKEIAHFSRSHPALGDTATSTKRGLIRTSKGLLLVAIAPVLKSDQSGPAVGRVISAKLLDIDAVKRLTNVNFTIEPLPQAIGYVPLPDGIQLKTLDSQIETTSVLMNLVGRPLAFLKANSARDVSRAGSSAVQSAMFMMMLAGFSAIAILWVFLGQTVIMRIEALKAHFDIAGRNGKIRAVTTFTNDDEIGELAQSFNSMADQVNHLRDALADSAYMSGLSEWAAGTLHNVRNGLAPVTVSAWQLEQLFEPSWVKNIETAAAELADSATPPERRVKLNAFLAGSAVRFVDAAKLTREFTGKINGASSDVLGMVTEFERYAHRKTELEAIDLLPLIKDAVASTIDVRCKQTEIVFPSLSALATGNGIILRQIFSNIFVNALEAIAGQANRGRIEITISANAGHAGYVNIAICDNGEGLSRDRLQAIFRRGESSRHHRSGGLGLHWCANAIKVLGGNIHAESDGPGRGAKFIVELPISESQTQEAA
jgi:two-component system, NtrC family, sensor kinase